MQGGRDERRIADLPGQRERLAGQRDRAGRVADKHMTGRSDAKLKGGVREVTAGSRYGGGPLGERAASANAPVVRQASFRASH